MSFLLYIIALLVSGGAVYFVATKIESKWEKGAWVAVLWAFGTALMLGLSFLLHSVFQNAMIGTDPTTKTIAYFVVYAIMMTLIVISIFYFCKKLGDDKWCLQIILWYAVAIIGTSLFLHIFRLISSLTVYVDTIGVVLMVVTGVVAVTYWRNGKDNGLQFYLGVVTAHLLAIIITGYLLWAFGIATMDNMAASRVTLMPIAMFYAAYFTGAFVLSLGAKALKWRLSYWLNWIWVTHIMGFCLITGILQITGIISSYELELIRHKNISEGAAYSARVAASFNTARSGFTYSAARAVIEAGTATVPQLVQLEKSIDEHYSVYLTIPKPHIHVPKVYENTIGTWTNGAVAYSSKLYSDWGVDKKSYELKAALATYEKFGIWPEEARAVIQSIATVDLEDPTVAETFKTAVNTLKFYESLSDDEIGEATEKNFVEEWQCLEVDGSHRPLPFRIKDVGLFQWQSTAGLLISWEQSGKKTELLPGVKEIPVKNRDGEIWISTQNGKPLEIQWRYVRGS